MVIQSHFYDGNQEKASETESLQLLKTHLIPLMVIMEQKIKKIALELADMLGEKYNEFCSSFNALSADASFIKIGVCCRELFRLWARW